MKKVPPGFQEMIDYLSPTIKIRDPDDHSIRGKYYVEGTVEMLREVVNVRPHEARVDLQAPPPAIWAMAIDSSEMSAPVTLAPSLAHESVSCPKWH